MKLNNICKLLKIRVPIIQAPMAGGIVSPQMITKVQQNGGLGTLPLGYLSLDEAKNAIQQTKAQAGPHFATNIFVTSKNEPPAAQQLENMILYMNQYREILGLPPLTSLKPLVETSVTDLMELIIQENIPILSFTFGSLGRNEIKKLHNKGIVTIGTATTVQEGLYLEEQGCNAVVAQGFEAGGHRGGFLNQSGGLVGSMALIPQMVSYLKIPVIAAGGIMDGRGIAAAFSLGASAVCLGTAFLMCQESLASQYHKETLKQSFEDQTQLTSVFTGKPARGITNQFILNTEKAFNQQEILSYPNQHQLTKEIRAKANQTGNINYTSFWSGQGTRLSRCLPVAQLMQKLIEETNEVISAMKLLDDVIETSEIIKKF